MNSSHALLEFLKPSQKLSNECLWFFVFHLIPLWREQGILQFVFNNLAAVIYERRLEPTSINLKPMLEYF